MRISTLTRISKRIVQKSRKRKQNQNGKNVLLKNRKEGNEGEKKENENQLWLYNIYKNKAKNL